MQATGNGQCSTTRSHCVVPSGAWSQGWKPGKGGPDLAVQSKEVSVLATEVAARSGAPKTAEIPGLLHSRAGSLVRGRKGPLNRSDPRAKWGLVPHFATKFGALDHPPRKHTGAFEGLVPNERSRFVSL